MSTDTETTDAPKKKKGGMKKILLIAVGALVLIGGGAGGAIYASRAGLLGGGSDAHAEPVADTPKLVPREGATASSKGNARYQATYFEIEKNFTSNLVDADGFMQLSLGVSTYYDNRVIDALKRHEVPVRSAVLMTLSDQHAAVISTPDGRKQLQKALKDAINRVLVEKEGFGGIDDVYFTSFVIQ